ncbi:NUDIX hydrolase domain-like protein [Hypoxylon trugodes]|uniref:NUDIX hydrolase domain-like protein n=1 Tax=Hypoxylon trugodes TaxID=326681 RepID=UPI002196DAAE|nr:NUDIX hydrolase domain-like protein [Hypoxylon trugodes]KAI1393180.1 NUDIX hydrolase domain-like protein [Hypoxylon trugodes]
MAELAGASAGSAPSAPTAFTFSHTVAAFNLTLRAHLDRHPEFDGIAVGAFVFNPDGKMLLVQRAAHDSLPLLWEIPGGASDPEDESLLHAAVRELWEETGLHAKSIVALVDKGQAFLIRGGFRMCKFSFLIEVKGYDVKLDPNEHQAYLWVTEEEAQSGKCGEIEFEYTFKEQQLAVYKAFKLRNGM